LSGKIPDYDATGICSQPLDLSGCVFAQVRPIQKIPG
jgi:hypothetical protein